MFTSPAALAAALLLTAVPVLATTPTPSPTPAAPHCMILLPTEAATAEATDISTPEVTAEATETGVEAPIHYLELEPFDLRFNPNAEAPFAVVMNYTLFFENTLPRSLDVRRPQFTLEIEGVDFGDMASTDFAMGQIQGGAEFGIVLQHLTLLNRASEGQKQVLECIRLGQPVDVTVRGQLESYPEEDVVIVPVEMTVADVVFDHGQNGES
jgi:hypothetical protein